MEYTIKTQEKDEGFKQMIILIDPSVLKDLKKRALDQNMSLKKWVLQAIAEKIARENRINIEERT